MTHFYINRKLHFKDEVLSDQTLLRETGVILVLAEPGAGKTDLLKYLARGFGVSPILATIFRHSAIPPNTKGLVIDGLDEVARIDGTGTDAMLVKARDTGAATVILASRSYVWDDARTRFVRDCFGVEPKVIRLEPFDKDEQRRLFEVYLPAEDFTAFRVEAERFELTPLLGNPQFLQLFADAFVQGGRHFTTKAQIYVDAVNRLASERSTAVNQRNRPPIETIVDRACEIFAKVLLSGAVGVSISEDVGETDYPYLPSLSPNSADILPFVADTRLFKPSSITGKHEPVHRIVAEYCAARYLASRIDDPGDVLSLRRCLAVIAPNSAVRDELRGMLGWMATLGSRVVQEAVIDLDPYAVFGNGDPSQLAATSKRRLLQRLKVLADNDPYFRRTDAWRRFNVGGFFTNDIVDELSSQLRTPDTKSHLTGLLLELLLGSAAVPALVDELRTLMLDRSGGSQTRLLAHQNLVELPTHDHRSDFDALVSQSSAVSLRIASAMVAKKQVSFFGMDRLLSLLKQLATIYPTGGRRDRAAGSRYFVRELVSLFSAAEVRMFLDHLTSQLHCICGQSLYRCECRVGASKLAGLLIDRYFEDAHGPRDPRQILAWIRPLVFRSRVSVDGSASLQALGSDHGLRQAIQRISFEKLETAEEISQARGQLFLTQTHAGLHAQADDVRQIVDHAFKTANIPLWQAFFAWHNSFAAEKGANPLRSHMRAQARQSDSFLRAWTRMDREHRRGLRQHKVNWRGSSKNYERIEERGRQAQFEYLRKNRELIESGGHWGWLHKFATYYLHQPDQLEEIVDDSEMVGRALRNSFEFLSPHVPTLADLAEGKGSAVAEVLHAACLATFRQDRSLSGIDINVLKAVKADSGGAAGYRDDEERAFEAELDGLLFPTNQALVDFAKVYLETQLEGKEDSATGVEFLNYKSAFEAVRGSLALDWLGRYPFMPFDAMNSLFGMAARYGERASLNELIIRRCSELKPGSSSIAAASRRKKFWQLRHFFFISPTSDEQWVEYSSDPKTIFSIEHYAGAFGGSDAVGWPTLSAEKIYLVLNTYVESWPKVDLPSSYGTGDPEEERAYRFLTDVISEIGRDDPAVAIPTLDRIVSDKRFLNYRADAKSLRAAAARRQALSDFTPPKPREIARLLDESKIASVEDLRALLVELLGDLQVWLKGAETDPLDVFYPNDKRVDENTARNRIVEMLQGRLNTLNLAVVIEHHMANANRCDITASTSIDGRQILLVTEVKGQWHPELYTAASTQLFKRYMTHPSAAQQGIYLVLWFGGGEKIAGHSDATTTTASQLHEAIIRRMPVELRGAIDVVVFDISRPTAAKSSSSTTKKRSRKSKAAPLT